MYRRAFVLLMMSSAIENKLPIRLTSKVVKGFNRGSKDLGIPTANLSRKDCNRSFDELPCGIYYGFARIIRNDGKDEDRVGFGVYKSSISIGFNPTYGNTLKTVEPHLIAEPGCPERTASDCNETVLRDFYGYNIRLSVVGYLRPELPFEGIEKLKEAIKNDISNTENICEQDSNSDMINEKRWVSSDYLP